MAKKTIGDCIQEARGILQDTVEPYRYPDADLLAMFNNAQYELKRLRPDVWLGAFAQDLPIYESTDLTTEVPFNSIFFQPVVLYMAGYAELRDDEFTVDARAATLLRSFARQVSAPGAGVTG